VSFHCNVEQLTSKLLINQSCFLRKRSAHNNKESPQQKQNRKIKRRNPINPATTTTMINSNNNKRGFLVFALMSISHIEDSFAFFQKMKPQSTSLRHFATKKSNEIEIRSENPFRNVDVDIDKAQDCASHFGAYPADEVEHLRDGKSRTKAGNKDTFFKLFELLTSLLMFSSFSSSHVDDSRTACTSSSEYGFR
jgi:hypothetical protein